MGAKSEAAAVVKQLKEKLKESEDRLDALIKRNAAPRAA